MNNYQTPTLKRILALFLLVGPLIWPLAYVAVDIVFAPLPTGMSSGGASVSSVVAGALLLPLLGGLTWWLMAFTLTGFLITVVPTAVAGVLVGIVLKTQPFVDQFAGGSRGLWVGSCAASSALASALTFAVITHSIGAQAAVASGRVGDGLVLVVASVGAALGALIGVMSKRQAGAFAGSSV